MKKFWSFISNMGYCPDLAHEEVRRIKLLSRVNSIIFMVLCLYVLVNLLLRIYVFIPFLLVAMFFLATNLILLYKRAYTAAKHFSVFNIAVAICFFSLFTGDMFTVAYFIPLAVMPLVIFKCHKTAGAYLAAILILSVIIRFIQPEVTPFITQTKALCMIFSIISIVCSALIAWFLTFYYKTASEEYESTLIEMNEIVNEKHKEITDSINYAERIQRSFIATKELLDENLSPSRGGKGAVDYFVFFKPKDIVSGDFYWACKLSNGNFALATADSTGHGVPGAIMSLLNVTSLEKAIENHTQPADILNATRKIIIERLKKDGSAEGGKDGMDASLTVYDFAHNKLIVAAANNPVWIVRKTPLSSGRGAGGEVEVIEIKPDKMPVGKHDKQANSFTQQEVALQSGDVVFTLTDGFPDQFGGDKGKKFMSKNLRELLAANAHLPMQAQKELLDKTFTDWVGNLEQVDDVTLIGVRV